MGGISDFLCKATINGKVNSGDIYASRALFAKLWPKLIKANAVEALAELQKDLEIKPVSDEWVRAFLAENPGERLQKTSLAIRS